MSFDIDFKTLKEKLDSKKTSSGPCPACGKPMINVLFVCGKCWWEISAPDRMTLGKLHRLKAPTAAKLAQVVEKLKAKQAK